MPMVAHVGRLHIFRHNAQVDTCYIKKCDLVCTFRDEGVTYITIRPAIVRTAGRNVHHYPPRHCVYCVA